jgi:transcriptional regulator with XRE-family HTH domain
MTFKEKVVKLRKLKGLTQDEFASAVGVSRQAVYKWESGQSYPEVSKLLEMKLLFNISIDDLLDDSYDVEVPEKKKKKRIPKALKEEIEKAVEEQTGAPVEEETPVVIEPEVSAEAAEQAPGFAEEEPVSQESPASEAEDDEPKKKVGFFGRLFGKK